MHQTLVLGVLVIDLVAACGVVNAPELPEGPEHPDAPSAPKDGMPTTYRGMLSAASPVTFGGNPYCVYTITLRQIDIQVTVQPPDQVIAAEARNLNVEAVVPPCPHNPLEPSIATYKLASTTTSPEGISVALDPAPTNSPIGVLRLQLTKSGTTFRAHFEYDRIVATSQLDWLVVGSLVLLAQ